NLIKECQAANVDSVKFVGEVVPDAPCGNSIPRTDILTVKSNGDENESNVPINKNFLAAHSTFFNALFIEKRQSDRDTTEGWSVNIVPPDTVENFSKMIDVLHLGDYVLNDKNVENVLRLANQFLLEEVEGKCKRYLTSEHCKIPTMKKFQIAEKYGLDALGEYILFQKIEKSDFDGKNFIYNLNLTKELSVEANQALAIRHRQLFPAA
uniref:BTB domain-containing protein n=1 Tax=Globodera pallida TaxID=36090 RepID=A0A183CNG0_GLOPA